MEWGLQIVLRGSVLVVLATFAAWLARKKAAALRRQVWSATILGLLLLPIASATMPRIPAPLLPGKVPSSQIQKLPEPRSMMPPANSRAEPSKLVTGGPTNFVVSSVSETPKFSASKQWLMDGTSTLALVYFLGAFIALVRLCRARAMAQSLVRGALPSPPTWLGCNQIDVRESVAVDLPITVGALRPVVIVPAAGRQWPQAWRQAILTHEAAHVSARDPMMQLLAELCVALYWFFPLVYWAAWKLRAERELAADDVVLASDTPATMYATLLYELATINKRRLDTGALVPLLTTTGLKTRVVNILEASRVRRTSSLAMAGLVFGALLAFVPLALATPTSRYIDLSLPWGDGALMGFAVDAASGKSVAGAEIFYRFERWPLVTRRVITDDKGRFRYPWNQPLEKNFGIYARKDNRVARVAVTAVPLGTALPLTMNLREAFRVSGTVRAEDGNPLVAVAVSIFNDDPTALGPGNSVVVSTDHEGHWEMPALLYGAYRFRFVAPSGVQTSTLVVVDKSDVKNVDVIVPSQWPISARFVDEEGNPLPGLTISTGDHHGMLSGYPVEQVALEKQVRHVEWDTSDGNGAFRLFPVGLRKQAIAAHSVDGAAYFGTYSDEGAVNSVHVTASGHVANQKREPRNIVLKRGSAVSGVVTRPTGEPITGADVTVAFVGSVEHSVSDENGAFVLLQVPPGQSTLVASEKAPPPGAIPSWGEAVINVSDATSVSGVQIVLR